MKGRHIFPGVVLMSPKLLWGKPARLARPPMSTILSEFVLIGRARDSPTSHSMSLKRFHLASLSHLTLCVQLSSVLLCSARAMLPCGVVLLRNVSVSVSFSTRSFWRWAGRPPDWSIRAPQHISLGGAVSYLHMRVCAQDRRARAPFPVRGP